MVGQDAGVKWSWPCAAEPRAEGPRGKWNSDVDSCQSEEVRQRKKSTAEGMDAMETREGTGNSAWMTRGIGKGLVIYLTMR